VNELKNFTRLATIEATSFLLLLVASVIKHTADAPIGVAILGPIHGLLFLGYVVLGLMVAIKHEFSLVRTLVTLAAGVVPFGGYFVDRLVLRWAEESKGTSTAAA
jgi:integral membrane protein